VAQCLLGSGWFRFLRLAARLLTIGSWSLLRVVCNLFFLGLHLDTSLRESDCTFGRRSGDAALDTGLFYCDHLTNAGPPQSDKRLGLYRPVTRGHLRLAVRGEG
jgi:hypothetical protein